MDRLTHILVVSLVLCGALHPATAVADSPLATEPAVSYLSREPAIDGALDPELAFLPLRRFGVVGKSAPGNPDFAPAYRLAYGAGFFYVFIEIDAEALVYRDRAYQNGDGFTLVLARPQAGGAPSREFYVLACSAVDRPGMEWSRKAFWYYNVDHIFLPVSDDTKMVFADGERTIAFELLLPWKDVHPYHPWLGDGIGFNLGVAKAVGEQDLNTYKVLDAGIGSESSPREYARLQFEAPRHEGAPRTFVLPDRNTIAAGDTLRARAVTIASTPFTEHLRVLVQAGEKSSLDRATVKYPCEPGLTFKEFTVASDRQPAGGYVVQWRSLVNDSRGESGLSILPPFDPAALHRQLDSVKRALAPGSYTTLQFTIAEIERELDALHPYETAAGIRIQLSRLVDCLQAAAQGEDVFARQRGFVRMAYRSKLDDSFQPYMIWLPPDFDPKRKYPLLVYLHGSASSERDIMGIKTIPDGFIALAPRGRGPSNWYSWDDAQTDIAEAVQAAKDNFPIDNDNVFLSGFSMGGYGVYRTYYESPDTYRAIAIFSGTPRITFAIPQGVTAIDFNEPRYLKTFADVPIFVFHGERDLNVSYKETEAFVAALKGAGANVEFVTEPDKGHEAASDESVAAFFRWVSGVLGVRTPLRLPEATRIVAIGDLHGDLGATRRALRLAGAIDERDRWIGGSLVVVQTGDQLDRGDDEQAILDLFARLAREAASTGGAVHALNGNHELMNAALDLRYVTPGGYADFRDAVAVDSTDAELRSYPDSVRARIAAFRPGGPYARLLAERNVVLIVGDNVFVHGGILPEHVTYGLDRSNAETQAWLCGDGPKPEFLLKRGSPVWARNYSDEVDDADCAMLREVLASLSAKRMIVGHTVQEGGIRSFCDGQVWCIDAGMSVHYGGEIEVLEIMGASLRVLEPTTSQ
jgi:predicted esterase